MIDNRKVKSMVLLHKKQISLLRQKVDKMLALLKWYSCDELISIGKEYTTRKKYWDEIIEILKRTNGYYQSPVKQIPNDIWSFAKMKGFAGTEDSLKEWFLKDVPAFGYLSPMQILQIENGDDILRSFMYDSPI